MKNATSEPTSPVPASLSDLGWMCGGWAGALGPQTVEEAWSQPAGRTMSTMVRLLSPTETLLIELIVIREEAQSLVLHLRQFTPTLETHLSQDMPLSAIGADSATFQGPEDSAITQLCYRAVDKRTMEVDVTTGNAAVLTATLQRRSS